MTQPIPPPMSSDYSSLAPDRAGSELYSTLRHGLDISNCDSEPVKTPGCVQTHGALLVLRASDLCIRQVSDNVDAVLGHRLEAILHQSVSIVIGADGASRLRTLLTDQATDCNPLYLMTLPASASRSASAALDVTAHTIDGVVILEFESTGRLAPANAETYAVISNTVGRLQSAGSLLALCDMAAAEIRHLSGMDRVMVYKFHEDGHGEVVAESKRPELATWVGMHYPAEDIPKPARDLFSKTWLRPIPDMSDALSEMVPLANPDTGRALDMTYCYLRGVSKMCTEFYRNMGVAATLTLSIRRGGQLWGLISCTYSAGPRYLSYQVRAACEFLAQVVSIQHSAAEDKEHLRYRLSLDSAFEELVLLAARGGGVAQLADSSPSLLGKLDAGGAALFADGRWSSVGSTPDLSQLSALGDWLQARLAGQRAASLYATDSLMRDYAPAAAFADVASGMMAWPVLNQTGPCDLLLWFRPETMQSVTWGGNPDDKPTVVGPNGPRLTPRSSFEAFVESVRNRALPWKAVELDAVARFGALLVDMVSFSDTQRQQLVTQLAHNDQLLDAFQYVASRSLKEPLRGVQQVSSALITGAELPAGQDRDKLDRMLRLSVRMDGLLDSLLHVSSIGTERAQPAPVDLNEIVAQCAATLQTPPGVTLQLVLPAVLPTLSGHPRWYSEIMLNLMSNALRYSQRSDRRIEIGAIAPDAVHARTNCPDSENKRTIFYVADNGIGIAPEFFSQVFKLFRRLHEEAQYGGGTGAGLTVARKLVARHGGQIWLASTVGTGTTVFFTLPDLPADFAP